MNMKRTSRKVTCIGGRCFANEYDAGKYLLKIASEHQQVTISHFPIKE